MNWVDILLLILVAGSVASAFTKGFSRELIGLFSVLVGVALGTWFYGTVAYYLLPFVQVRSLANLMGFLAILGAVILLGSAATKFVRGLVKVTGLSFLDRLLGAGFGFLRGGVIAAALLMAVMAFTPADHPPEAIVESHYSRYFMDVARVGASMAPYELREGFRNSYDEIKGIWNAALKKGARVLPNRDKEKR